LQYTKLDGVRLGEWNLLTNEDCETVNGRRSCAPNAIDVNVTEIILHEDYNHLSLNQYNDIALLRLADAVTFNYYVKPICLQQDKSIRVTDLIGQSLVVTGFGATETSAGSLNKLHVALNVVDNEQCDRNFRIDGRRISNTTQICAGGAKGKDSCSGDR
jgi:hypothetical protein